jgi:hypothetical protein
LQPQGEACLCGRVVLLTPGDRLALFPDTGDPENAVQLRSVLDGTLPPGASQRGWLVYAAWCLHGFYTHAQAVNPDAPMPP